uniref:Uncharacterized protein n=1 Tax=Anguilla anguilla TaxID=7936 RepID=A0A0E9UFI1_ANGAN
MKQAISKAFFLTGGASTLRELYNIKLFSQFYTKDLGATPALT